MRLPEIGTARLRMRPLSPQDLSATHRLWNEPGVRRYLWDDEPVSREKAEFVLTRSAEHFERRGLGIWTVFLKGREDLVGFCGFWPFEEAPGIELLYGVAPPHWGVGLATEAARAMIRYGFEEADLDRIVASVDTANGASLRVLEKAGMRCERHTSRDGQDLAYYGLARETFRPEGELYSVRRSQRPPG